MLLVAACDAPGPEPMVLCGDSTMAEYGAAEGIRGWGQMLEDRAIGMPIVNRARYGATATSFLEDSWASVGRLSPSVVVIQFGHNPESTPSESLALERMVSDCRRWGARAILVTPMADRDNRLRNPRLGSLMRSISQRQHVPLVPLDSLTTDLWRTLDRARREESFVDGIHLSREGAARVAALVTPHLVSSLDTTE